MKKKIIEICSALCCKSIADDEELILSGLLDSYGFMELISAIEENFNVVFQADEIMDIQNFSSVNKIENVINKKKKC